MYVGRMRMIQKRIGMYHVFTPAQAYDIPGTYDTYVPKGVLCTGLIWPGTALPLYPESGQVRTVLRLGRCTYEWILKRSFSKHHKYLTRYVSMMRGTGYKHYAVRSTGYI